MLLCPLEIHTYGELKWWQSPNSESCFLIFFPFPSRRISGSQVNSQKDGASRLTLFVPTLVHRGLLFWHYRNAPPAELSICDIVVSVLKAMSSTGYIFLEHLEVGKTIYSKIEYGHIIVEYWKFTYIFRIKTRLQENVSCSVWCIRTWLWLVVMVMAWGWSWRGDEGNAWKSMSHINK